MPPKKRARLDQDESSSDALEPGAAVVPAAPAAVPLSPADASNDDDDSDLPMCAYGATCYRKNPDHFKSFRHPPGHPGNALRGKSRPPSTLSAGLAAASSSSSSSGGPSLLPIGTAAVASGPPPAVPLAVPSSSSSSSLLAVSAPTASSAGASAYASVLQLLLAKNRVSTDDKKLALAFRKSHGVSDEEHAALLKRFGWTGDEWEVGEKEDDGLDLDDERQVLRDDNGFSVIRITKRDAESCPKDKGIVFARVSHQFLSTMAKAQANFTITEVGVIVSTKLYHAYQQKKLQLQANSRDGSAVKELWGFHGTSRESIMKIAQNNFLLPDEIAALKQQSGGKGGKGGKKGGKSAAAKAKQFGIEVLDDGYFGKGVYFTAYSDYAAWYSAERNSDQVLLSKLLVGKQYNCTQRMDGERCRPGYDSHQSPKGNEFVLFTKEQILPRYIITFEEKDAMEREQES